MKKLILFGLAGALAILLAQGPLGLYAMDSGLMNSNDYNGYDMGSGMMRYGDNQNYGTHWGMMNRDDQNGSSYCQNQTSLDQKTAERELENYIDSRHNPNLRLGKIKDEGSFFEADLLTKDNSLVDKLMVDKNTGRVRSAY